jgi:alpha,alpha-trehalase
LIGNCCTAALVKETGSIDWCCMPYFDSPSVFGQILDAEIGGCTTIEPVGEYTTKQKYLDKTNILETIFTSKQGKFVVYDYMPRFKRHKGHWAPPEIHRLIESIAGKPEFVVTFTPRFNYGKERGHLKLHSGGYFSSHGKSDHVFLYTNMPNEAITHGVPVTLTKKLFLNISYHEKVSTPSLTTISHERRKTAQYWREWVSRSKLPKKYRKEVIRSALALKLMAFDKTGAVIAAPTTSLPETVGGERNWDYRYSWLRDASMTLSALNEAGHFQETKDFIRYLLRLFEDRTKPVQIVYGIDYRTELKERILPHLSGYKNSKPVRVGNAAYKMGQHDIFGEVLHTLALYYLEHQCEPVTDEIWSLVKFLTKTVTAEWKLPDNGIWEFRGRREHFLFSKMMAWVALDRAIAFGTHLKKPNQVERWQVERDTIFSDIMEKGWHPRAKAFTQSYGIPNLDASTLLMPAYGFLPADHPKMRATIESSYKRLVKKGFTFRYTNKDDFGVPKNAFAICSFWMMDCLHAIGKTKEAVAMFEQMLSCTNHVGLMAEDVNITTHELCGNFPQAYSHCAIIHTAFGLDGKAKLRAKPKSGKRRQSVKRAA